MEFVAPSKSIFTSISEFFTPPNRAIGPPQRTQHIRQMPSTPIAMRSPKQQLNDGGATRASESIPFSTRFALLVFSFRLKFTNSGTGLEALKAEVTSLKKSAKSAGLLSVVDTLETIQATIEIKLDPLLAVSSDAASGFWF